LDQFESVLSSAPVLSGKSDLANCLSQR